ncbi:MAG: TraR/DksA family transcriptional regulator [Planctomycetes bacterium]|nr:TraR/DksA family transcriptional regulator [Planctomycetota bacterium]
MAKKKTTKKSGTSGKASSLKSKPKATVVKGKGKSKAKPAVATPTLKPRTTGLNLAQGTGLKIKPKLPIVASDITPAKPIAKPVPKADNGEEHDEVILTEDDLRKVKTGLTKKDLDHYWSLLLEKRSEILGDVESLQTDAKNDGGNLSNMPLHMADVGSDNYEQEFTLGLVESERKLLKEITDAMLRIKSGTYGVCLAKGVPINRPRLDVTPWAKYCIEAAREMERRGGRR